MSRPYKSNLATQIRWTIEDVKSVVQSSPVVVFSKGPENEPKCGFSKRAMTVVESCGRPYEIVDVSENRSIRAALAAFSGEQSLPLVYVDGQLVPPADYLTAAGQDSEIGSEIKARARRTAR